MMDVESEAGKAERAGEINSTSCNNYSGMVHSKKVIKHALRQQAKRRRKNTTIASGNSRALPQIVVKPLAPPPAPPPVISPPVPVVDPPASIQHNNTVEEPAATMREVLASLPGFSLKSNRRRSTKKLSAAAQLEAGLVDLESPASILASTSLRALLNRHTFQGLPPLYQRKLAQLLPAVDRQDAATSGLNNEFFARACLEWRKRLAEGEFTPENQQRLKMEAERDKNKLDPWKLKHFEPIWGEKREPKVRLHCINETRTTNHAGAVTRSSQRLRHESPHKESTLTNTNKLIFTTRQVSANPDKTEHEIETENEVEVEPEPEIIREIITEEVKDDVDTILESENQAPTEEQPTDCSTIIEETYPIEQLHEEEEDVSENVILDTMEEVEAESLNIDLKLDEKILEVEEDVENEKTTIIHQDLDIITSSVEDSRVEFPTEDTEIFVSSALEVPTTIVTTSAMSPISKSELSTVQSVIECQTEGCNMDDCLMTLDHVTDIQALHEAEETFDEQFGSPKTTQKIFEIPEGESNAAVESISCHETVKSDDLIIEESVINVQIDEGTVEDIEPIPPVMDMPPLSFGKIQELEIDGAMTTVYDPIAECTEEIIYPILEGIDGSEDVETQNGIIEQTEEVRDTNTEMTESNEDEELRDANNYVCSEMLDCSWSVEPAVSMANNTTDIQVPWPLVAAALDSSVAANITVTTHEDCSDTSTTTDSTSSVTAPPLQNQTPPVMSEQPSQSEAINPVSVPVQGTFQETITLASPGCVVKSVQSQNSPIVTFPPMQSIRLVPRFNQNPASPTIASRIQPSQPNIRISTGNAIRASPTTQLVQTHPQSAIVVQQPTAISVPQQTGQNRQVVASVQPQQQYTSPSVNSRSRSGGQSSYRGNRNGNKEQGGRSRSSTKEPPGVVNLERSYQICQAVIQSSPNRDQLKAHLKPPPSLLARGDGAFTTTKSGGRTITTVKTQKQPIAHNKPQNKTQTVMLRQVFTTTRQQEVADGNQTVAQLGTVGGNGSTNFGQYILVQRTGVSDGAPRASSAPPIPPQIAGIGVHLVRGRPASAGEGSHQAVTLKARGTSDGRGGGGAEPAAPAVIMGGDPPPPCDCHIHGAMVVCQQCGAFCHDDCTGAQRLCSICLIR